MRHLVAVSILAIFAAGGAFAGSLEPVVEDTAVAAPAAAPTYSNWTGFYVGGTAGWMMGDSDNLLTVPVTTSSFDGALYGGFAGYTYELGSGLVLGGELAGSTGTMSFAAPPDLGVTLFDAKVRLGYAMGDALVYATGGYTFADYDNGDQGAGWNLGAGVEYMVTDSIFIGGEYLYRDITDTQNTPEAWEDKFGTISARVGFRF